MDAAQPMAHASTYPVRVDFEAPHDVARWRPLVHWLLAIPHYFAFLVVAVGAFFAMLVSFFAVLFTGRYPEGMRNSMVGTARYYQRLTAYVYLMTDVYPPFSLH